MADKGYISATDQSDALAAGIIPNVITRNGNNTTEVSFDYKETDITNKLKASTKPEDIKACLEAGIIPNIYKDILSDVNIKEKNIYISSIDVADSGTLQMTSEQMRAKAMEGYFIRDVERDLVYCPQGNILRQKSVKRNGNIRYCNKLTCKRCKNKCTVSDWKEVDFNKDTLIKSAHHFKKGKKADSQCKTPKKKIQKTIVSYTFHLAMGKMAQRKCLSEHPFGTIKRSLGAYYFLLKTKVKVETEMALFCLSYNIRRAITMLGVKSLIAELA